MKKEELSLEQQEKLENKLNSLFQMVKTIDEDITSAKELGDEAKQKAESVHTGVFRSKNKAIEELKDATIMNADTTIATLEVVDKVSENHRKMANACTDFIKLGVVDMASNRAVIEFIRKVMSGEESQGLSEETKSQLLDVIKDLKEKEDILIKQRRQGEKLKEHEKRLNNGDAKDTEQDKRLDLMHKKNLEQDERLTQGDDRDKEQDIRLDKGDQKDREHDDLIKKQQQVDLKHDKHLDELDNEIAKLEQHVQLLENEIRMYNRSFKVGILLISIVSSIALILGIIIIFK